MIKIVKNEGQNRHLKGKYLFCTDDFDGPEHMFYANICWKSLQHWIRFKTSKKYREHCVIEEES